MVSVISISFFSIYIFLKISVLSSSAFTFQALYIRRNQHNYPVLWYIGMAGEEIVIKEADVLSFCDSAREYLFAIVDRADKIGRLLKITITKLTQDDANAILNDYINNHSDMNAHGRFKDAFSSEHYNFILHKNIITLPSAERIYYKLAVDAYDCLIVGVNPRPAPNIVSISSVLRTAEETKGQAVFCLRELIEKELVPMCRQEGRGIINSKATTPGSIKVFRGLTQMNIKGAKPSMEGNIFYAEILQ